MGNYPDPGGTKVTKNESEFFAGPFGQDDADVKRFTELNKNLKDAAAGKPKIPEKVQGR